jgi:LPXTG-motif cell wall-anchored protein
VVTKQLLNLPLAPVATADIQPDRAEANTASKNNFCVLGAPLSEGTATIANANVLTSGAISVLSANGTVKNDSTEELDPNGAGALGLNSVVTMNTAGITLFKGIPGAAINIKVVNPLILKAFAGGVPGSAKVTYGSNDGKKDVLKITAGGHSILLTVEQLLGTQGATIPVVGTVNNQVLHLLNIQIGGMPTVHLAPNGTKASAVADLVKVQVINTLGGPTTVNIGGPLGAILQPVLSPVVSALDKVVSALQPVVQSLGLQKGVDLRVGHFEANSQVPVGGIKCGLPVHKSTSKDPVNAGDTFTVTISAHNPYDCVVRNVRVVDNITATGGVKWTVDSTQPKADKQTNSQVVWNNIGNIKPGGNRHVAVTITIDKNSIAGQMRDHAHVSGTCATGNGPGTANVRLAGNFTLHAPNVNGATSPTLPNTGSSPWLPIGGGVLLLTGLGLAVARRRSLI